MAKRCRVSIKSIGAGVPPATSRTVRFVMLTVSRLLTGYVEGSVDAVSPLHE